MKKAPFLLIFLAFFINTLNAQTLEWEKMQKESEGGWAEDIVVAKGKIWMSNFNELFESSNGGATWKYVLTAGAQSIQYSGSVNYTFGTDKKIIVSGDSIFFGTQFSPDNGTTWNSWSMSGSTLPSWYFSPTVINIKGNKLYLGALYNGFFQSDDLGKTFTNMNAGLPNMYGYYEPARAVEFYNGQPVIATHTGLYLWNGSSWIHPAGNGLLSTVVNTTTTYLVDRIRFLNSMWIVSTNFGVYYSNDQGANWQRFLDIPQITGIASWDMYSTPAVFYNLDVINGKIFVSYESEVYISSNSGTTWTHSTLSDKVDVKRIATVGSDFLAATSGGIYRSTDGGSTWKKSSKGFERTLYTGVYGKDGEGFLSSSGAGILKSSKRGEVLTPFNDGLTSLRYARINAVLSHDIFSTLVKTYSYAGTTHRWDYSLYQSKNDVPQWDKVTGIPPVETITHMQASANGSYIINGPVPLPGGQLDIKGMFLSKDQGQTWNKIFTGITTNNYSPDYADNVTSVLYENDTIYVGTLLNGIYKSWDQGTTWTSISNGLNVPDITNPLWWDDTTATVDVITLKSFENNLYAVGENFSNYGYTSLFHSADGGKHWTEKGFASMGPAFANGTISSMIISEEGNLVAQVYRNYYTISSLAISYDQGNTWEQFGPDFPDGSVYAFGFIGDYLYASGKTGLWRFKYKTETVTAVIPEEQPSPLSVYPNPFNDQTTVTLQTLAACPARVEIFSSDGRQVLATEHRFEEGNDFVWKGKDDGLGTEVPPGLYIVKVTYNRRAVFRRAVKR